ncbi:hypothetical protein [Streptomyces sp. NPDC088736]|uniref:hypothetical protein n=1 Tax=Streptomyces sp. NPDC088736 TaxID=3365881 RepID=UPI0037FFCF91
MSGDTEDGQPGAKVSPKLPRPRQLSRPRVGWPPALRELKELLYEVYLAADAPSLDEITKDVASDDSLDGAPSRDTVHRVLTHSERPGTQADVLAVATVLGRRAAWDAPDLASRARELWVQARMARGAGRPIGELRGDLRLVLDAGLGVHSSLDTDDARDRFGILPAYIPRDHDARLKTVVDAAKAGRSAIAVLVGGSSTGKTRTLWEAVSKLPSDWRLWHPLSPTAPSAALAALPEIAPKTVVWLNEAQNYLEPAPLGEQVAAGLRELLNDPSRAPVLILGTLWPEHWNTLTTTTVHAGARALLAAHKIDVPETFTPADLASLETTADGDPRLTQATQHADDARITQYLAGVPYLLDRYGTAGGATRAVIECAMDARRLGAGLHLPLDWLASAAPGYLTDTECNALDADWLTKALAYVTEPCNGIPGILTPVNTRGPRNQRTRRCPDQSPQGPHYLLTDYLDQHGRHHRDREIPPVDFWTAAATHAHPTDLATLGQRARTRGLYRDAAQLLKHAAFHGDTRAAVDLISHLHTVHPGDHQPAQWAASHVAVDGPVVVAMLLRTLLEVGADDQVTALAERAASHAALDNPVAMLLRALLEVGADDQVTALAERAASHAALDEPEAVAMLLRALQDVGADDQVTALLARDPASHATLNSFFTVAGLLRALLEVGADDQVTALAERVASHAALDNPGVVAMLLRALQHVGADDQVTALAERAASHVTLNWPPSVAELLRTLREVGADEQASALAERYASHASHVALDDPEAVARLQWTLQKVGAEQASALAERVAAQDILDDPGIVAMLLEALRKGGADDQVTALLARDPASHATLDNPVAVAMLLRTLREGGADDQVTALLARDPASHATLDDPEAVAWLLQALREVGPVEQVTVPVAGVASHPAPEGLDAVAAQLRTLRKVKADEQASALAERVAPHAALHRPGAVAMLLRALREIGADEPVTALLARDPASHADLDWPPAVAILLEALREVGADEQVTALAERVASHIALDDPEAVARLLRTLRRVGAGEQASALAERVAAQDTLEFHTSVVIRLLEALREIGADEQAATLTERLPAAGHFDLFMTFGGNRQRFRLGREPDGSAAPSWTWNDLD